MEQLSTEQLNTHPMASPSPSPQMIRDVPPLVIQKKPLRSEPDLSIQTVTEPEVTVDMNDYSVSVSGRSEEIDGTRSKDSSAISDSTRYSTKVEVAFMDMARRAEKPDLDPDHSTKLKLRKLTSSSRCLLVMRLYPARGPSSIPLRNSTQT
jgi:hypothetical protein